VTRDELAEYFNEHILYELLMLRYARRRLQSETQILWNAMFSAFNVSARNLYEFLNNKGTRNEVNVHDYRDVAPRFDRGSISDITGTLQLLNEQCFHMGKKRPKALNKKVSIERIETVFQWVESNMGNLVDDFDKDFRPKIELNRADPDHQPDVLVSGPTGPGAPPTPSATNHVTFSGNGPEEK
jgi:hypothetical protein